MKFASTRDLKNSASFTLIMAACLPFAAAQSQSVTLTPPEAMALSPYNVDLKSGSYKVDVRLLAVGDPAQGGMEFRRITRNYGPGVPMGKMAQFNHNWDIRFKKTGSGSNRYVSVTMSGVTHTFKEPLANGSQQCAIGAEYKCLARVASGSNYYYIMSEKSGRLVESQVISASGIGLASKITDPDGTVYSLAYDALGPGNGVSGPARLLRVVSNRGYALIFENAPNSGDYSFVSKVCALNLSITALPSGGLCPSGAVAVLYGYSGQVLTSEQDPSGAVWGFSSTFSGPVNQFTEQFTRPGGASPYLSVIYSYDFDYTQPAVIQQAFAGGPIVSYNWDTANSDDAPIGLLPSYFSVNGEATTVQVGAWRPNAYTPLKFSPGPEAVTDALGRTTYYDYCLSSCSKPYLRKVTFPDGKITNINRDGYGGVTSITNVAPTGSGLANIVRSATYDYANAKAMEKPVTITDANGNVTDFSYSYDHGGILTETQPAVNGIRPQKRFEYSQRYAWIKNSSGGYAQAASPIWVLVRERYCRASAASGSTCAGGSADEVVTDYDYGPDTGPNTLVLRGVTVSADGQSLRTCYGYDSMARKISETRPRAGLSSCP
ncbi:hypothetical protein [Sphingomonas adhaesiva]|uniref:hypothetical protein n=1 Tax=Sphingomonas adhaesiva TaxID=28212 RepID=UPI002FFAD720